MAQPMPESVKVARAEHAAAAPTAITGSRFDVIMGPDEVMILLAFHWWYCGLTFAPGVNECAMGLWRQSEALPAVDPFTSSPDMIWAQNEVTNFVVESVKQSNAAYIALPRPMILIRPPQFVIRTVRILNMQAEMRLYYQLREVSDVDLAKLMVKDHA